MLESSAGLKALFGGLAIVLAVLFVTGVNVAWRRTGGSAAATRRATLLAAGGVVVWLAVTLMAAASGRLRFDTMPPTAMFAVLAMMAIAVTLGTSRVGARLAAGLPLAALVGVQSFRLPLELMMHRAYTEGVMPVQMSYSGYNFDIVTGLFAIVVAIGLAGGWLGEGAVRAWNWIGSALLANVIVIALLSAPTPLRVFTQEPANVWVTQPPFVWLPTVMVLMALLGHIVVFRRLRRAVPVRAGAVQVAP